jgi:hypothetical protein
MPPPDTRDSRQSPETRRFQVKWVVLYSRTTKITTQRVRFPRVPVLRPFRGEGVLTPLLTSNRLVSGLIFLTDRASSRYPGFPSEPRNQEVPG